MPGLPGFVLCPECRECHGHLMELIILAKQQKYTDAKADGTFPKGSDPSTVELLPEIDITIGDILDDLGLKKSCCRMHITGATDFNKLYVV